jgi:Mor family transcriptional regulator
MFMSMFGRQPIEELEPVILGQTKKRRNIVHGGKAIMKQLPAAFQRPTRDYDLWSRNSKRDAFELQALLDKKTGGDNFYDSSIPLAGSNETVYRVVSRIDGKEVADFMKMPGKTKGLYKVIGGIRYETLEHAKQQYRLILNNPQLRHRHSKSARDLERIIAFERSLKKGEPTEVRYPFQVFQVRPQWRF